MPSWRLMAAWVVVVAVVTALAWQIVSLADSRVGARAVDIVSVASSTSSPGSSEVTSVTTSTSTPTSSTSTIPASSQPPTDSSSWSLRTINTTGGRVVIRHRIDEVELEAATPAPGFDVEIDDSGPRRVRVEFESSTDDIRVEAEWRDDNLVVDVTG